MLEQGMIILNTSSPIERTKCVEHLKVVAAERMSMVNRRCIGRDIEPRRDIK